MKAKLNKEQSQIWQIIKEINHSWYKGSPLKVNVFLHPEVVFNIPDYKHQNIGKKNCIQTYIDFLTVSEVISYHEHNPS